MSYIRPVRSFQFCAGDVRFSGGPRNYTTAPQVHLIRPNPRLCERPLLPFLRLSFPGSITLTLLKMKESLRPRRRSLRGGTPPLGHHLGSNPIYRSRRPRVLCLRRSRHRTRVGGMVRRDHRRLGDVVQSGEGGTEKTEEVEMVLRTDGVPFVLFAMVRLYFRFVMHERHPTLYASANRETQVGVGLTKSTGPGGDTPCLIIPQPSR